MAISLLVAILCSCASTETANSDAVKQTEIYQQYSITYDAGDKECTAFATFRFGGNKGTTLILTNLSEVFFNHEKMAMEQSSFSGTYYKISKQADYSNDYFFKYINNDKKVFNNNMTLSPIIMDIFSTTLDKREEYKVTWRAALLNSEEVILTIQDEQHHTVTTATSIAGANSITVKPDALVNLQAGNGQIYLTRKKTSALSEANALGGTISITYISAKQGIKIR